MRWVWAMYFSFFNENKQSFIDKKAMPFFANYLWAWDVTSSMRVEYFIAISNSVSSQIQKYYGRMVDVIAPPS